MILGKISPLAVVGIIALLFFQSRVLAKEMEAASPTSTAPPVFLTERYRTELRSPGSQTLSPIRDVDNLVAAGPGRLAFLREGALGERSDLVVVNEKGIVLHIAPLTKIPMGKEDRLTHLLWQHSTHFLVFVERNGDSDRAYTEAYQVDTRTASVTKLAGFRCPSLKTVASSAKLQTVASSANGGFVVLATIVAPYRMQEGNYIEKKYIYAYNSRGKQIWVTGGSIGSGSDDPPGALFFPESLTVLRNGDVAVIDAIKHTVQLYNRLGHYQKTIFLDTVWNHTGRSYPSNIVTDQHGGFLVNDFGGVPSEYWMTTKGEVQRKFTPRYPNGTVIEYSVTVTGNGRLWLSDNYYLLRLDTNGRIDRRLGDAPDPNRLTNIIKVAMTTGGRFLAVDTRTNAVHVFDSQGHWLHVCKPRKAVQEGHDFSAQIEIGPDERFAIAGDWFDREGKPCNKPIGFKTAQERISTLKTRPDGSPLQIHIRYSVAPDGSLALIDQGIRPGEKGGKSVLCLYSATDTPQGQFTLPTGPDYYYRLAYDGKQVVVTREGCVYCYLASGELLWKFVLPLKNANDFYWTPFLMDNSRTLYLFDGERTIYQFAMPQVCNLEKP